MKSGTFTALAVAIGVLLTPAIAQPARTTGSCVGGRPGCYATLQAALNAASDGDTITILPGTYGGGVTIDRSVSLVGAGARETTISGGGPVLTIGRFGAGTEPTVSIEGVTITGGVTRSSPESTPFTGQEGVFAAGGGVEIPPNADFSGGATVTISNSVITGNRVAPSATVPFGPPCPDGPCPFAGAFGGGIDNWGTLTLANSTVSDNRIGTASGLSELASDAEGAGIRSWLAALTITNSVISGNQASASAPNGRFADSGGIFLAGGSLSMTNSAVTDNSAALAAALPNSVDLGAHAGGVHIADRATSAAISNSTISGNSATMTNAVGDSVAFSGGLHTDIDVTLSNVTIADNHVSSATTAGSTGNADGESGGGEISGTLGNVRFVGNSVDVTSAAGNVTGGGGGVEFDGGTMTNVVVSDNHFHATAPLGSVDVRGGGINAAGGLDARNTTVSGNTLDASAASGSARGGGVFDAAFPDGPDGAPGGPLVLRNSTITGNTLSGNAALTLRGGGLYLQDEPLTLSNSSITHNLPDDCVGC